jgi:hypothetical protein
MQIRDLFVMFMSAPRYGKLSLFHHKIKNTHLMPVTWIKLYIDYFLNLVTHTLVQLMKFLLLIVDIVTNI